MSTAVADWPKFLAKLQARQEIAERTMAFRFEKPASFKFTPGQFIDITLLNPKETDSEGNTRGFSIASAPHGDFIMVATRYGTQRLSEDEEHPPRCRSQNRRAIWQPSAS